MRILHLYRSEAHNFFGHHGRPAGTSPMVEVPSIECVAGKGIRGDRYFDHKPDYKGQVTFFAGEVFEDLCERFHVYDKSPLALRRNIITGGVDLNDLIGQTFEVQGVQFSGIEECRPCYWMDTAFHEGAEEALRGNGGLRARILTDGTLTTG